MENRMHDDGEVRPKSVREVAAAVGCRNTEIQREGSGLGRLEKRWREEDRVHVVSCGEAVGLRKPLPPPIRVKGLNASNNE